MVKESFPLLYESLFCNSAFVFLFLPRMVQILLEETGQSKRVHGCSGYGTALTTSILLSGFPETLMIKSSC